MKLLSVQFLIKYNYRTKTDLFHFVFNIYSEVPLRGTSLYAMGDKKNKAILAAFSGIADIYFFRRRCFSLFHSRSLVAARLS